MNQLRDLYEYREFLREFTAQQLRARYRTSVFGYLWTLLNPLLTFLVFLFIFAVINRLDLRTFAPYFFAGYLPWFFFVTAASLALGSITTNTNFVTHLYAPKSIFPVSMVILGLIETAGIAVIVLAFLAVLGRLNAAMLVWPFALLLLTIFVTGVCFTFAAINVFFRDATFLWNSVNFLWFFCTPIAYTLQQIPEDYRSYYSLNPFFPFVQLFQDPVVNGYPSSVETYLTATIYALVSFVIGSAILSRSSRKFYAYI